MAKSRKTGKLDPKKNEGHDAPWRQDPHVHGVVPPGRRLANEPRDREWRGSGTAGITPPGTLEPGKGPGAQWAARGEKRSSQTPRKVVEEEAPPNLKEFLDRVADFIKDNEFDDAVLADLAREIRQTRAPFEIIVTFTVLSALVGENEAERRRHHQALERGAKAYYNLAKRIDKRVRPPRGLAPQTLDPIFYDLPDMAYQIPNAFVTQAFWGILGYLHGTPDHDRKLLAFANTLRAETVEGRRFGDQTLEAMFPMEMPDWSPE